MGSFPQQFFSLLVASLSISAVGIAFSSLSLTISPIAWCIPVVVIITFTHHTYILLHGHSESYNTPQIYSKTLLGCTYLLVFLWIAAFAATGTITYLLISGIMRSTDDKAKIWVSIMSGTSLLEVLLVGFIAIQSRKETKRVQYSNKWQWRVDVYTGGLPTQRRSVEIFHCRCSVEANSNELNSLVKSIAWLSFMYGDWCFLHIMSVMSLMFCSVLCQVVYTLIRLNISKPNPSFCTTWSLQLRILFIPPVLQCFDCFIYHYSKEARM